MSYHGYLPILKSYLSKIDHLPSILEVGIDRGVMFLTLVMFLARTKPEFFALGVDVLVQEQVNLMLQHMDLQPKQHAFVLEENSLDLLPKIISQGMKFDVLLLDGDHNYHTVSKELTYVDSLVRETGIVVIDDYSGRWGDKDLFYSQRVGYEDNPRVTALVDTEKHGVKPAVDEWLTANPSWTKKKLMEGEPVLLYRTSSLSM